MIADDQEAGVRGGGLAGMTPGVWSEGLEGQSHHLLKWGCLQSGIPHETR